MDAQTTLKICGVANVSRNPAFRTGVDESKCDTHTRQIWRISQRLTPPQPNSPQGVYAAQMLGAPQWANDFYYKEGHKSSPNWQNWCVPPSSRPLSRTAHNVTF